MTDKQLLRYAAQFRRGILSGRPSFGMCFAVCAPLVGMLGAAGVPAKLVEGAWANGNHFWIELEDSRVLDPTADQFNAFEGFATMPGVYLGSRTDIHRTRAMKGRE